MYGSGDLPGSFPNFLEISGIFLDIFGIFIFNLFGVWRAACGGEHLDARFDCIDLCCDV